jgi:hypothetical protein
MPAALLAGVMSALAAHADVAPVAVSVPDAKAWVGQRATLYVELRAPGSFVGTANFELPQIPGTLLMKVGNPVVLSKDIEGASWFVQTHEFALFSQKAGVLEVPAFPVTFSRREGFVGPATEVKAKTPTATIKIRRPADSEQIGFLVTTESLEVTETWDTPPGPAQVGAMFKRTIVQRSQDLPGMALAPAPTAAPDGIKAYPGNAQTKDNLERGNFLGERRETITYLLQKPGPLSLPALTYVWWNPKSEKLQSKTLPGVTFEVAAPPPASAPAASVATRRVWPWLLVTALVAGLGVWQGRRVGRWATRCWKKWNPPDRVAARQLLRACRRNDAAAAATAWSAWRTMQCADFPLGHELRTAILCLQRNLFGPAPAAQWQGLDLARTFGETLTAAKCNLSHESASPLPELNPQSDIIKPKP